MASLQRWAPSERWTWAVVISAAISILYSGVVFGYSVHPASNVSISGSVWQGFALYSLLAFGTIGVPALLWIQYGFRSPVVLSALVLLFWHVLVEFPPIGSGQGDSPGFLFVFVWAPIYLVAYGLLAAGEYWLRGRDVSASPPRV